MTRRENTAGGSASIVIIAILFLALMGTLGVVFYQNFVAKPASKGDVVKTETKKNDSTATKRVAFDNTIYAFDYPKAWSVTTIPMQGSKKGGSITTIVNTNKTVGVNFTISEAVGGGGSCNVNTDQKISYYNVVPNSNTKLTAQALSLVEALYDYPSGGYQYNIGLSEDGGETHASVGDPFCSVSNTLFASHVTFASDGSMQQPTISLTVQLPSLPDKDKGPASPDMQTIKDLMNSDDYKAAVKILESARKE